MGIEGSVQHAWVSLVYYGPMLPLNSTTCSRPADASSSLLNLLRMFATVSGGKISPQYPYKLQADRDRNCESNAAAPLQFLQLLKVWKFDLPISF
jgi:hypothetical protein